MEVTLAVTLAVTLEGKMALQVEVMGVEAWEEVDRLYLLWDTNLEPLGLTNLETNRQANFDVSF